MWPCREFLPLLVLCQDFTEVSEPLWCEKLCNFVTKLFSNPRATWMCLYFWLELCWATGYEQPASFNVGLFCWPICPHVPRNPLHISCISLLGTPVSKGTAEQAFNTSKSLIILQLKLSFSLLFFLFPFSLYLFALNKKGWWDFLLSSRLKLHFLLLSPAWGDFAAEEPMFFEGCHSTPPFLLFCIDGNRSPRDHLGFRSLV